MAVPASAAVLASALAWVAVLAPVPVLEVALDLVVVFMAVLVARSPLPPPSPRGPHDRRDWILMALSPAGSAVPDISCATFSSPPVFLPGAHLVSLPHSALVPQFQDDLLGHGVTSALLEPGSFFSIWTK